jgi:HK97 family phage major capsid protein
MANQKPISTTNAAGGYLVQPEYQRSLLSRIARENAVFAMADTLRVNTKQVVWPVYLGRPTAGFVAEAATKPTTGAEFGQLTANLKKIATNVRYTTEILEDAAENPQLLIGPDVVAAINDLAEYHALGTHVGAADTTATYTTSFDSALQNTTTTVELGSGEDALADAISSAVATLEGNGYTDNLSVIAGYRLKQHLRDARDGQGLPLYYPGFNSASGDDVPRLWGLPVRFSTNLNKTDAGTYNPFTPDATIGGAGSPPATVAIVGAFQNAKAVIRSDISTQVFREATIDSVNLAETNQIAVQYETRIGFQVYDLNAAFVRIINAA